MLGHTRISDENKFLIQFNCRSKGFLRTFRQSGITFLKEAARLFLKNIFSLKEKQFVSLRMAKDRIIKTNQGNLEIWKHQLGTYSDTAEQKYASRIFNRQTHRNDLKIHTSAKALELYIDMLNLITPSK